jgi:hypothetical protein
MDVISIDTKKYDEKFGDDGSKPDSKPNSTPQKYSYVPPEGDEKVGQTIFSYLQASIEDKINLGLHQKWTRDYELRMNKHWRNRNVKNVKLIEANLIYTHIQRTTNTITDNNPTFNVAVPGGEQPGQEKELYFTLQKAAEHWWIDQEQQDMFETSVLNGETYNICIEKVIFNVDLEHGIGEVETVSVDPFNFGWYPVKLRSLRDLQKHPVLLHWEAVPITDLKIQYPQYASQIKPINDIIKDLGDDRREISGEAAGTRGQTQSMFISILSTVKELFQSDAGQTGNDQEDLVCEAWVIDKTTVTDDLGVESPKYPGYIRKIKVCCGGKLVLEDVPNPNINSNLPTEEVQKTYLFDKRPFAAANSVKDTSNAWGMSHDVEQLQQLNIEVDKAISQLTYFKDKVARPKLINPKDSGVPDSAFNNDTGIVSPSSGLSGQGIRWMEMPPLPIDIERSVALYKDFFMLIGGTFDLDQAQVQGRDVIAYKAIAALIERAATMMRGKLRSYGGLVRERGRMYLSHVMNFYTEDRWIPIDEGGTTTYKTFKGTNFIVPAKLTVVTGSTMPISKIQQREEALGLYGKQAIDRSALLERLDWPDRANVTKRMDMGPIAAAIMKLGKVGIPPDILQYIGQIVSMDEKELAKGVETGKVTPFSKVIIDSMAAAKGQPPPQAPAQPEQLAQAQKADAESQKIMADRDLIIEKIVTERVTQQQIIAGIQFDQEQLKIERAKVVNDIEKSSKANEIAMSKAKTGYNEKGMKSNNKKE